MTALFLAIGTGLISRYHHPVYGFTSFLQLEPRFAQRALPELATEPVYVHRESTGYDGQFYAQLALRPALNDPALEHSIDNAPMRARRILMSWLAYVTGGGDPRRTLHNYAWINVVCWYLLALVLWQLVPPRSWHGLIGWAGLLFSAGVLTSIRYALTDLPALLLIATAMLALKHSQPRKGLSLLGAAAFARETSILAALPWLLEATWRQRLLRGAAFVLPLAAWLLYIRLKLGTESASLSNFDWPLAAAAHKLVEVGHTLVSAPNNLLAWLTLGSMLGLFAQAGLLLWRRDWRNPWWQLGAPFVVLFIFLGWKTFEGYPGAVTRILLPLHLAFTLLAPRTRIGLALLMVGNLSIGMGLTMLRDHHGDPYELTAIKTETSGHVLRLASGAYPVEVDRNHRWSWAQGRRLVAEVYNYGDTPPPPLHFWLQGFTLCEVTIQADERLLWKGTVKPGGVDVVLTDYGSGPRNELIFTTTESGQAETAGSSERRLTFALYDVWFLPTDSDTPYVRMRQDK